MPKLDIPAIPVQTGTRYPPPHDAPCRERAWKALGLAGGLTQFGVNLLTLKPGVWSSQRHWHAEEDEFAYVLSGEVVLIDDAGEHVLRAGDAAAFPKGDKNGHHFINKSGADVTLIVVGARSDADHGGYSDIDMLFRPGRYSGGGGYTHKDGTPY
jgi:uncharacterized cupin superfamily protein